MIKSIKNYFTNLLEQHKIYTLHLKEYQNLCNDLIELEPSIDNLFDLKKQIELFSVSASENLTKGQASRFITTLTMLWMRKYAQAKEKSYFG